MPAIMNDSIKIAYEISGRGNRGTIVLIRGQGTQLIHWPETFYQSLADRHYRVIRFDNRDTGLSSKIDSVDTQQLETLKKRLTQGESIDPPYTLIDMAKDVVDLLDELKIEKAHIVGISMGGCIAQILASRYPERLLSMTSIMSGSNRIPPGLIETLWSKEVSREAYIDEWVDSIRQFGSPGYEEPEAYSRRIAAAAYDRGYCPDGANRQLLAIFSTNNLKDMARSITVPSLIIHGSDDRLIPPDRGRETASLIPNATYQLIEGMGHNIPPRLGPSLAKILLAHIEGANAP